MTDRVKFALPSVETFFFLETKLFKIIFKGLSCEITNKVATNWKRESRTGSRISNFEIKSHTVSGTHYLCIKIIYNCIYNYIYTQSNIQELQDQVKTHRLTVYTMHGALPGWSKCRSAKNCCSLFGQLRLVGSSKKQNYIHLQPWSKNKHPGTKNGFTGVLTDRQRWMPVQPGLFCFSSEANTSRCLHLTGQQCMIWGFYHSQMTRTTRVALRLSALTDRPTRGT